MEATIISLNEKFSTKTPKIVFKNMDEFWLRIALSDENSKCVSAGEYLRSVMDIEIDTGKHQFFSGSHFFLMHKMLNTPILKERLFNIIKDNGLYNDYLLRERDFMQWINNRYYNENPPKKTINWQLRIVR